MNSSVNWIAAYNYLFASLNSENKELYVGGSTFCRMVQQVDPGSPSYQQLMPLRQSQGKSSSAQRLLLGSYSGASRATEI
ncbi:hypothetical protein LP415_07945 [Polaromonas sp. P1(28)-8]|nr:hypothetical protein LP415_07945 [Polaromonas sp. P1(28)-8]